MRFGLRKKTNVLRIGELLGHELTGRRVILRSQAGSLEVSGPLDHVLRLRSGRAGLFSEDRSFAVTVKREELAPVVSEDPEKIEVQVSGLRAMIGRGDTGLHLYDRDGALLFRDHPAMGLGFTGSGVVLGHVIEPGVRYFGFGEKTGPLDKRGQKLLMWNTDMVYHKKYDPLYVSIPLVIALRSGRAHGLFFDNPSRSRFNLGAGMSPAFIYAADAGELDLYIIEGPKVSDVVERFTALTGRLPLPPRWALGHHQCRWSYMNENEVMEIADGFRSRDLPTDAVYLDIHYLDRYRVFTFHPERFPEPGRLAAELGKKGFRLVSIIDPGVAKKDSFPLYTEAKDKGYFCRDEAGAEFNSRVWPGEVAFPDFSKPEVRKWWGDQHRPLVEAGIAGIWNDMNEPSCWSFDVRTENYMLPLKMVRRPKMVHDDEGRNTPHLSFRNVYGQMMARACREGLQKLRPGQRPFVITRAGYAGIQREATVWTGDNSSRFSHLALSIPMLLNLGLSGVTFCGADIGGFMWSCSPELYARWIQLGAFYPFCRTHTAIRTRRQEPWTFGGRVEKIAREYLKLRYRLHPTLYSLIRESHETGAPVLRPLFYEFQDDHAAAGIEDQLMFGPWLLLAPVVKKGQLRREVYLPAGLWTDFFSGERIIGPKIISRETPLELMPIYAREGAILFFQPALSWLEERPVDRITIELFPPERGSSEAVLYEDDGQSEDYLKGVFCKRRVTQEREAERLTIKVSAKDGPYEPPARTLMFKVHLTNKPEQVSLDGKKIEVADSSDNSAPCGYVSSARILYLSLADNSAEHAILIE